MNAEIKSQFEQLVIYGVGLLGASLGLAARRHGLARRVVGIGRYEKKLQRAVSLNCIDAYETDPAAALSRADFVILCTPVQHIIGQLPLVAKWAPDGALVTDVGSTKSGIVEAAAACFPAHKYFVGSHPIAGGEKTGAEHGRADLFDDACCVLTRTPLTDQAALLKVRDFWKKLGCRIIELDPAEHDRLLAAVSHLPHMVAAALIETLRRSRDDVKLIREICGNGLRDTTRVAAGSPEVWRDICGDNRAEILRAIDQFIATLMSIRAQIGMSELTELERTLGLVSEYRKDI